MLDFTSALYLGLRHASWSLRPWAQLTTGAPAALVAPPGARAVADALAALQGCQRGTLAPSTLHLFWDLFGMLPNHGVAIYISGGTYPIARWGVERAAARGVPVRSFPHHDAAALWRQLQRDASRQLRPVVVADGLCPDCGAPAPVAAYLENVRAFGGLLILDDTQALGVLGSAPKPDAPYGHDGGGSLPWSGVGGPDVLVGSSLAKGFGVPVAVLAGSETMIGRFKATSETRVHCSPPSLAVIHAAEGALEVNRRSRSRPTPAPSPPRRLFSQATLDVWFVHYRRDVSGTDAGADPWRRRLGAVCAITPPGDSDGAARRLPWPSPMPQFPPHGASHLLRHRLRGRRAHVRRQDNRIQLTMGEPR
jgi:hypothetical protein